MADLYGAKSLPITAAVASPITVTPGPDPLLTYLASYLKTVANGRLVTAWRTMPGIASPAVPIEHAFEHDPELFEFNDNKLPALFVFRQGGASYEQLTADWRISTENVSALWILPGATQDKDASRGRFATLLFALFDAAIERNRDKAWLLTGDAEAKAAREGSSLAKYTKHHAMKRGRWARKPIVIRKADGTPGAPPKPYWGFELPIEVKERLTYDPEAEAELAGASIVISGPTVDGGPEPLEFHDFDVGEPREEDP